MLQGYAGRILTVNLQNKKIIEEELEEAWCKSYVGGKGFAAKILLERSEKGVDPLSEGSLLIFAVVL